MEKQRHIVMVHGASHGAWCWYKVAALLKSSGHKVTALDLAACGVNPEQVHQLKSISDYSEPLMDFMMSLPSEERVILVAHSFGGLVVSFAMERFPDKVSAGVFATAMMPGPDLSYKTLIEEYNRRIRIDEPDNPSTSQLFGPKSLSTYLYQLSPPEDLMLGMMLRRPHPLFSNDAIEREAVFSRNRYGAVPRIYIVCGQDNMVNQDLQRWVIRTNPPDEVKVIPDSDHMVMFSKPQELCSCLEEIAKKYA
ncbi:methyl jasmonate esterase 1 [Ricinus communis]|uniref:(S)-hydroxynitrile lyase n=1 Tax=Ricinus communis TaxID=3988 RepID=B9S8N0_RICCO|nr:methyl jasmonate esterase 1 [Ricinus communis]EEF40033.1 Polyneuridine-aldehyde esterase precursor, putative [Ricinus communis]|eukprot:XP_002522349.1 methylesterase 3 [Ricinus communis]